MKFYLTRNNNNPAQSLFDTFFDNDFGARTRKFNRTMHTDIVENEKNYLMNIELAGFNKEQIKLDYDNGYLTVVATKEANDNDNFIQREQTTTRERSYYIGEVDLESLDATYENGMLSIIIPKEAPVAKNTSVNIK